MANTNPARETEVLVVGGGPAGLAAAIAARQHGMSVLVADHARPPIDKACGEGLMPDSLEVLAKLGVSLNGYETGSFSGIRFISGRDSVDANFPNGRGLGIRRPLLHGALLKAAEEVGVDLLWESRVSELRSNSVCVNGNWIRCRWIIGADGNQSQVRKWTGLERNRSRGRRIALRRHFMIDPWSRFVEIYWGEDAQAYVTPIGMQQICVALISKRKMEPFETEMKGFPALMQRLDRAPLSSSPRGGITWSRAFEHVVRGNVALIGEAAGSVDAITGEGLALAFRQALALGRALAQGDLRGYELEHHEIMRLPTFMAQAMLLMDKSSLLRRVAFNAFLRRPGLFARMLAVHVGEQAPSWFGEDGILNFGWELLTA